MNGKTLLDILSAIATVALVTTIVGHAQSANVIKAVGSSFSGAITASLGAAK